MTTTKKENNVISLKAYKTLKECEQLFQSYQARVQAMKKTLLLLELTYYRKEAARYPNHLLTLVRGKILIDVLKECSLTNELKQYVQEEEERLSYRMKDRLKNS